MAGRRTKGKARCGGTDASSVVEGSEEGLALVLVGWSFWIWSFWRKIREETVLRFAMCGSRFRVGIISRRVITEMVHMVGEMGFCFLLDINCSLITLRPASSMLR